MTPDKPRDPLSRFGEFVVQAIRDRPIQQFDALASGMLRGKGIQELQTKVSAMTQAQKEILRDVVTDTLEVALHDFLFALQDAHDRGIGIEILVDGQSPAQLSGMLQGEPVGPAGWISRFSKYPSKKG